MKTAKHIRDLQGFAGHAALYELSEPVRYGYDEEMGETIYVIASTADVMFSGVETYLFPANADGMVIDWGELPGSMKGVSDHSAVLADSGFPLLQAA